MSSRRRFGPPRSSRSCIRACIRWSCRQSLIVWCHRLPRALKGPPRQPNPCQAGCPCLHSCSKVSKPAYPTNHAGLRLLGREPLMWALENPAHRPIKAENAKNDTLRLEKHCDRTEMRIAGDAHALYNFETSHSHVIRRSLTHPHWTLFCTVKSRHLLTKSISANCKLVLQRHQIEQLGIIPAAFARNLVFTCMLWIYICILQPLWHLPMNSNAGCGSAPNVWLKLKVVQILLADISQNVRFPQS